MLVCKWSDFKWDLKLLFEIELHWRSKIQPFKIQKDSKNGLFEGQISNGLVFKWQDFTNGYSNSPNHLKTRWIELKVSPSETTNLGVKTFFCNIFQVLKYPSSGKVPIKLVWTNQLTNGLNFLIAFLSHKLRTGQFHNQTHFDQLKLGHVRYSEDLVWCLNVRKLSSSIVYLKLYIAV